MSMTNCKDVNTFQHHAKPFVAIDCCAGVDAAATTMQTRHNIGLKRDALPAFLSASETYLYKCGVRAVDVLQVQLASHILQRFIVSVFAASVLVVARNDAQDSFCQALQCAHEILLLLTGAHGVLKHV